jgi:hypothetical protein
MKIKISDLGEEEIFDDLMDEIDADLDYAPEILSLAGRILLAGVRSGSVRSDVEYERALLRSISLATGEFVV